jgi:hypothetical protein
LENKDDVMNHFIKEKKPTHEQIIILYKLILFCKYSPEVLLKLARHLINNAHSNSTFFEKFKIKTLEQILLNFSKDENVCDIEDCLKALFIIENYVNKSDKQNLIFNY